MKPIHYALAAIMAIGCLVETEHMRHYMKHGPKWRVATTACAAIACAYIGSEALDGDWPALDEVS